MSPVVKTMSGLERSGYLYLRSEHVIAATKARKGKNRHPRLKQKLRKGESLWTKFYFAISEQGLFLSDLTVPKHSSKALRPIVPITQATKIVDSEYRDFCFEIRSPPSLVHNTEEVLVTLAAETQEDKDNWVASIRFFCKNAPPRRMSLVLAAQDRTLIAKFLTGLFTDMEETALLERIKEREYIES